ncbi:MAG: hypothetical protein U0176_06410 [Bacteroidia bacterium]
MRVPADRSGATSEHSESAPGAEGRSLVPPRFQVTAGPPDGGGEDGGSGSVSQLQVDPDLAADHDVPAGGGDWQAFATQFNSYFQSILHVFGPAESSRVVGVGIASGDALSVERLQQLFDPRQMELLMGFFQAPHNIPDGLFNGDIPNHTTAQQRLLMSAQILADGQYQVGSLTQRVHARMCFHWVQITHHYAGATRETGPVANGVMGNFDHDGTVVFGTGETPEGFHGFSGAFVGADVLPDVETSDVGPIMDGTSHAATVARARESGDPEAMHGIGRRVGMTMSMIEQIQPGDWLWYYNGNGSRIGSHSVIFSHWAGPQQSAPDGSLYRQAVCFSQGHPDSGGREHTANLGEHFFPEPHYIHPVVNWSRVDADAHPAGNLDEILQVDAEGRTTTNNSNTTYIQQAQSRRPGMQVNLTALATPIQAEGQRLLNALTGADTGDGVTRPSHLTEGQTQMLRDGLANGMSQATQGHLDGIQTLIRIQQRLAPIAANAALLDANTAAASERVEGRYDSAIADFQTSVREFWGQVSEKEEIMETATAELARLAGEFTTEMGEESFRNMGQVVTSQQAMIMALRGEVDGILAPLATEGTTLDSNGISRLTSKVRDFLEARTTRTAVMDQLIDAVRDAHTRRRGERARSLRQQIRGMRNPFRGYRYILDRQQRGFNEISGDLPYNMVHAPGRGGAGERNRRTSGLLRDYFGARGISSSCFTAMPGGLTTESTDSSAGGSRRSGRSGGRSGR